MRGLTLGVLGVALVLVACGGDDGASGGGTDVAGGGGANKAGAHDGRTGVLPQASPSGATRWSDRLGGALGDVGRAIAADSQGNVFVAGTFDGVAEVGGVPMTTAGMQDVFIAKFTPQGAPSWVRHFGGAGADLVTGIAVDGAGSVLFTGTSSADIDFGGGMLTGTGGAGIFLAKLDAYGNHAGSRAYGGSASGTSTLVAVDPSGAIVLAGTYQSPIDLGGGPLPAAVGSFDVFLAKYDAAGQLAFGVRLGGSGVDAMQGLSVDATGSIAIAGAFNGTADFGAGPQPSAGDLDAFVAKFDGAGKAVFAHRLGGTGVDVARSIAIDKKGDVVFAGSFSATIDLGGGPVTPVGSSDAFIAKSSPMGLHVWARTFGGAGRDEAMSVAIDPSNEVLVAGYFESSMNVGATPFLSAGDRDAFAVKLGSAGAPVFAKHFGAKEDDESAAIASDGFGRVLVTGFFRGEVDFGVGAQTSAGEADVFLATFEP